MNTSTIPFNRNGSVSTIELVDCTLRDGEQTPGVWFTVEEKIELATALDKAGISVLDAGFPASSAEDVEAMQEMRMRGLRARIAATSRPLLSDVKAAAGARAHEVFMFLAVSDQHLHTKLRMDKERAAELIERGIEAALEEGLGVSFVAEDAVRADQAWLLALLERVTRYPIKRVVICDTVGAGVPRTVEDLVRRVVETIPESVDVCMHCHNDFGMATANTIAGIMAGARSVSCTVNGIGERAGNADLAEVAATIEHLLSKRTDIVPTELPQLSSMVERMSGVMTSPLKPVTGFNVYAHESGVHVDGMLKDPRNYEHLTSRWVGAQTRYVLGKHSGRSLLEHMLGDAAAGMDDEQMKSMLAAVKRWVSTRGKVGHHALHRRVNAFRHGALAGMTREQLRHLANTARPSCTQSQSGIFLRPGAAEPADALASGLRSGQSDAACGRVGRRLAANRPLPLRRTIHGYSPDTETGTLLSV